MQNPHNYLDIYASRHHEIQKCSQVITDGIRNILMDEKIERIDQITGRAKSIERFGIKAQKKTTDGSFKYREPLVNIQDQIGVRIVVFYLDDVERTTEVMLKYYKPIEIADKYPEKHDSFSYVGKHFILFIPDEEKTWGREENMFMPSFFELQVKTMFQHAWAESEHDLNYKAKNELSFEDKRLIAFSAAQAWGADKVFGELTAKYLINNRN